MICQHCQQEIVVNPIKRSPEPFVYHPYKHKHGNLIGCFDPDGNVLGTTAEPEKEPACPTPEK